MPYKRELIMSGMPGITGPKGHKPVRGTKKTSSGSKAFASLATSFLTDINTGLSKSLNVAKSKKAVFAVVSNAEEKIDDKLDDLSKSMERCTEAPTKQKFTEAKEALLKKLDVFVKFVKRVVSNAAASASLFAKSLKKKAFKDETTSIVSDVESQVKTFGSFVSAKLRYLANRETSKDKAKRFVGNTKSKVTGIFERMSKSLADNDMI